MSDSLRGLSIRWLIRRDMPEVLDIEKATFAVPWSEDDFMARLRQRNAIGMVVQVDNSGPILGFMVYELHKSHMHVLNFAVHPDHLRRGIGRAMVKRLKDKLAQQRREAIELFIAEWNTTGQIFFRSQGFRWAGTFPDHYENDPLHQDAYLMQFRLGDEEPVHPWAASNRIGHLLGGA